MPSTSEPEDSADEDVTLNGDSEEPDFSDARHVDWAAVEWGDYTTFNRWREALQLKAELAAEEDWTDDDAQAGAPESESEPETHQVLVDDCEQADTTESPEGDVLSRQQSDGRYSLAELASRPEPSSDVAARIGKPEWWNRRPGGGEGA